MKTLAETIADYDSALQLTRTIYGPHGESRTGFELRREQAKRQLPELLKAVSEAMGREGKVRFLINRPYQVEVLSDLLAEILTDIPTGVIVAANLLYKDYAEHIARTMGKAGWGMTQWSNLVALLRDTATAFGFDDLEAPKAVMAPVKQNELMGMVRNLVRESNGDRLAATFATQKATANAIKTGLRSGDPVLVIGLGHDDAQAFRNYFLGAPVGEVVDVSALLDNEDADAADLASLLGIQGVFSSEEEEEVKPKRKHSRRTQKTEE